MLHWLLLRPLALGLDLLIAAAVPLRTQQVPLPQKIIHGIAGLVLVLLWTPVLVAVATVKFCTSFTPFSSAHIRQINSATSDSRGSKKSCVSILSANTCLLPDFAARFNGLCNLQYRAATMGAILTGEVAQESQQHKKVISSLPDIDVV